MNISYRKAYEADQNGLEQLNRISSDEHLLKYSQEKSGLFDVAAYEKSGGGFWVAEDTEKNLIVGMVGLRKINETSGKVKALRVNPNYRGQEIATSLMNLLEEYAKEKKYTEIVTGVNSSSTPAIKLYESLGYTKQSEKEISPTVRAYYYHKEL